MFRLQQVDPKPTDLESKISPTKKVQITEVPVEKQNSESILVHPKAEVYAVTRLEQHLVQAYRKWMESKGVKIVRHRVYPEGEANPLFTDAFDKLRNNLIEAKGSATRESIRMAIGQLADYGRFFQPKPQLAVLLPLRPPKDLENLLLAQHIYVVWHAQQIGFSDNASGAFT